MFGLNKRLKRAAQDGGPDGPDGVDPHLWLEEVEGEDAIAWVRARNERSLAELESDPRFDAFHQQALAIHLNEERIAAPSLLRDEVRNFWQDETHVRGLWRKASLGSYLAGSPAWLTILDIDALAEAESENWVFAGVIGLAPAHERAIVSLSRGGSDAAVRREFDLRSGSFVDGGFEFPEAKGSVAWRDEDHLFVALADGPDNATASGYPRQVMRLKRGEEASAGQLILRGETSDIGVWPATIYQGGRRYTLITRAVTFFESEHYLLDANDAPQLLPFPLKSEIEGIIDGLVIVSLQTDWKAKGASFKAGDLVSFDPGKQKATLVFRPSEKQALAGASVTQDMLLVQILDNVIGRVLKFRHKKGKWTSENVDLPGAGVVSLGGVNPLGNDYFLYYDSPSEPSTLYYADAQGKLTKVKQSPAMFEAGGIVTLQHEAKAPDGTAIPYFVIGRKDVIEAGNAPVIQYGYGGFEVPSTPGYSGVIGKLWLERGGVFVIANIRGGGEFGPKWHQAALKEKRQTGFDDFFAVSEDMIERGLTTPERLGAYGGSNGGLLMGVALTQRPDLYKGLAIGVPLLDMLRYTKLLAGASWVGEYGDPDDAKERAALVKYSPYQNLAAGKDYPCPFFFTSTKDDRVHPGHARKMAARMEELGFDYLYYENIEGGHGAAANLKQSAYRAALQYIYFWRALGTRNGE